MSPTYVKQEPGSKLQALLFFILEFPGGTIPASERRVISVRFPMLVLNGMSAGQPASGKIMYKILLNGYYLANSM